MKKVSFTKTSFREISVNEFGLIIMFICAMIIGSFATANGQDTLRVNRLPVRNNIVINVKTGRIMYQSHLHWIDVKSGVAILQPNGKYLVNGKEYFPPYVNPKRSRLVASK